MTLFCLFNADDFALNREASSAITMLVENRRLQATSILAGGEDQLSYDALKRAGHIFINVHLNLLEGKALTDGGDRFGITTNEGFFCLTLGQLILKLYLSIDKTALMDWIFNEFCHQIEFVYSRFEDYEIRLDGHLHIHTLPPLKKVIERLLKKYLVRYIRVPFELKYVQKTDLVGKIKGKLRRQLLASWSRGLNDLVRHYHVNTANFFLGIEASCKLTLYDLDKGLEKISSNLRGQNVTVEIMTHPVNEGTPHWEFYKDSKYSSAHSTLERKNEMRLLMSDELFDVMKKHDAVFLE